MFEVVTGGSGSGKSAFAEERICSLGEGHALYYIAAMIPRGRETEEKIQKHRAMRAGKGFTTLEWPVDLNGSAERFPDFSAEDSCVLVECMSNLLANELYEENGAHDGAAEAILRGIETLKKRCLHLVIVTNDVFREPVPGTSGMTLYAKSLGEINRALCERADRVTEVVYGVPCLIKEKGRSGRMESVQNEPGRNIRKRSKARIHIVTGGAYQGKREYADHMFPGKPWTDGAVCQLEWPGSAGNNIRICNFHLLVRRWMEAGRTNRELMEHLLYGAGENCRIVIVCDEVGCGLVPVDAFEREYRENVGRIMTELCREAETVDRIVCGIPTRIKQVEEPEERQGGRI